MPAAPPTQISRPRAASARNLAVLATGIFSQLLPPSSERCRVPSEDRVQRGITTTLLLERLSFHARSESARPFTEPASIRDLAVAAGCWAASLALPGAASAPAAEIL